jgi:hypothetical protein
MVPLAQPATESRERRSTINTLTREYHIRARAIDIARGTLPEFDGNAATIVTSRRAMIELQFALRSETRARNIPPIRPANTRYV